MNTIKRLMLFTAVLAVTLSIPVSAATVMIDPGHGGAGTEGCGAVYAPYIEKALTLDLSSKLCAELNAAGISAEMTRTTDRALSLPERASIAKNSGAKLLVSIHFNASSPHDKTGCAVWTSIYGDYHTIGAECGNRILSGLSALGLQNKGIWTKSGSQGDYYGIIRYGTALGIPTIIVEHCYMDYPYDRSIMESVGTAGFAHADAVGISEFLSSPTGQALAGTPASPPDPGNEADGQAAADPASNTGDPAANGAASADTASNTTDAAAGSSGLQSNFTAEEWKWLLNQWAYTGNAESYISQVPLTDLKALLEEHKKGNR